MYGLELCHASLGRSEDYKSDKSGHDITKYDYYKIKESCWAFQDCFLNYTSLKFPI